MEDDRPGFQFEEDEIMGETPIEEQLQVEFGIFEPRPEDESTIRAILIRERPSMLQCFLRRYPPLRIY